MGMRLVLVVLLSSLLALIAAACMGLAAFGQTLIESDDFTGQDGDLPDQDMWDSVKTTADDSVRLEASSVRTAVKNGGNAFIRSNGTFASNNVTMLVEAKIGFNYHRPIDVRLMTNHSGKWQRWLAVSYDPHGYGWSVNRWINDEPDGFNSYETTGLSDVWYLVNITVSGDKFDMTVTERDTGEVAFSLGNWTCDPLESENKVYFGVFQNPPGSWQDTICFYDNYRLYDLSAEENKPPVWGPLPVLEAVEDVPLSHDFTANVSDPNDPVTRLSISSVSPYVVRVSGLAVTFLFPNGVTEANIPLVLSDRSLQANATVRVVVRPVNDPPEHRIPANLTAVEDVPLCIDLSPYVSDVDNDTSDLSLRLDSPFVTASGLVLTAVFPNGVVGYDLYLFISDGLADVEARIHFNIIPVDDPPVVDDLGEFTATEDKPSLFNLTPYLHDEDTPIERLGVLVKVPGCTVDGHCLWFLFEREGYDINVSITIYDDHSTVSAWLLVHIRAVNDPPTVGHVPTERFLAGAPKTIDLAPYIKDEDTPMDVLELRSDHHAVSEIRGLNLTLLYSEWVPEHDVEFGVFDGTSLTRGSFGAQVSVVNLPPIIKGLTDPIIVEEATERWIKLRVEDEETASLTYLLESDWGSIEVFPNGTIYINAAAGDIGIRTAVLTVTDPQGLVDSATLTIEVVNVNDRPSIELVSPANGTWVRERTPLNFTVVVSDPDIPLGDQLVVIWLSNLTGKLKEIAGEGEVGFETSGLPVGFHAITVTVSDGSLEASITLEVCVEAEPPEPPNLRIRGFYWLLLVVVILVVCLVTVYYWMRSRAQT